MSGENIESAQFDRCTVVLVDVLGTTTSINFAKETLFPYVTKNVEEVLKAKWEDDSIKLAVKQLKEEEELDLESAVKLVKELSDAGSENAGLKTIQGIIYEKGYENGDLKSHVFKDVPAALQAWAKSRKVAVYSTGSENSQKQLFSNSVEGDLSEYISKYFDQSVGPKTESASYKKILEELGVKAEEVVFITDLIEEAKAAKSAGLSVALISREGNEPLPEESKTYPVISSFKDVAFENPSKRKNTDDEQPAVTTEEPPNKVAKTELEVQAESTEKVEGEAMEVDASVVQANSDESSKPKTEEASMVDSTVGKTEEKPAEEEKVEETPTNPAEVGKTEEAKEGETAKNASKVDSTNKEETSVDGETKDNKVDSTEAQKTEENKQPESVKVVADTNEAKPVENKDELPQEETQLPKPENGDVVTVEAEVHPPKKSDPEVASSDVDSTVDSKEAKPSEAKGDEEKENKTSIANGVEVAEKDKAITNGDASEEKKANGDADSTKASTEETNGKSSDAPVDPEEIKVKKVEVNSTPAETSAVGV